MKQTEPTILELSAKELQDILQYLEGLGMSNERHKIAKAIIESYAYPTARQFDYLPANCEANAGSTVLCLPMEPLKDLEYSLGILLSNADPVVADPESNEFTILIVAGSDVDCRF